MSQFSIYYKDGKCFISYETFYLQGIGKTNASTLYEANLSADRKQRADKENNTRTLLSELNVQQTREREERARRVAEAQKLAADRLKKAHEKEQDEEREKAKNKAILLNRELDRQRKAKEEERLKNERELLEEKRRLKELQGKLEIEKARQKELERQKKQEQIIGKEQELLKSIAQTENAISRLKSEVDVKMSLAERNNQETFQLLENLKVAQQDILRKEELNLELNQRYTLSERLRTAAEQAYQHEKLERQKEEAKIQMTRIESLLKIVDRDLVQKWRKEELSQINVKISGIKKDFEKGNFSTVSLSIPDIENELQSIEHKAMEDEKIECQREYVAVRFLKAIKYRGYTTETDMRLINPEDPRSPVIITGKFPSGCKAIEITIPFGEVYSIKFSGLNDEKTCCSEETILREILVQNGISSHALASASASRPSGSGMKYRFDDGKKKIELTRQFCG